MDSILVEGLAAVISAIIVFCGSVWLLLALVMGPRLAYLVTASVTLGFLLLMGGVWSYGTPLGPVGEMPSWSAVGIGDTIADVQFGPVSDYPDSGGWFQANQDDKAQTELKAAVEGEAPDVLEVAIEEGDVTEFGAITEAQVDGDSTRLIERDGVTYGAVRFEPVPAVPEEGDAPGDTDIAPEGKGDSPADEEAAEAEGPDPNAEAFAVLERDAGNPSGKARMITAGFFVLLVIHLLGLSWSEKRARSAGTEA